jgi:hypothetical protein
MSHRAKAPDCSNSHHLFEVLVHQLQRSDYARSRLVSRLPPNIVLDGRHVVSYVQGQKTTDFFSNATIVLPVQGRVGGHTRAFSGSMEVSCDVVPTRRA